jgi:hypothetical protein
MALHEPLEDDVLPDPVFIRPIGQIPAFTLTAGTRFILRPGQDEVALRNRVKNAVQRRQVGTRGLESGRQRLGLDDLAAALALFALFDVISDAEISQAASLACYSWNQSYNPKPSYLRHFPSPIIGALEGATRGGTWILSVSTYHCDQTDKRLLRCAVYNPDADTRLMGTLPASYLPRLSITVNLAPLLLPLTRALQPEWGN